MASYVESVLAPGERVVHRAAISHWNYALSYLVGVVCLAIAATAGTADGGQGPWPYVAAALFAAGAAWLPVKAAHAS